MRSQLNAPASIVVSVRIETEVAGFLIKRYPHTPLSSIISQTIGGLFQGKPLPERREAFEWIKESGTGFSRSKALADIRKEAASTDHTSYLLDMIDSAPPESEVDFSSLSALSEAFSNAPNPPE